MQGEQATPGHEKPHFVFTMPMLFKELGPQFGFLRVITAQADHVDGDVAALGHQLVDLHLVGRNHLFLAGAGLDLRRRLPTVEAHTLFSQGRGNVVKVGQDLVWQVRA
ncbi:hypothetical protein D3C80_1767590 [compost metagenome]